LLLGFSSSLVKARRLTTVRGAVLIRARRPALGKAATQVRAEAADRLATRVRAEAADRLARLGWAVAPDKARAVVRERGPVVEVARNHREAVTRSIHRQSRR
jgi:hypothetical protein